MPRHELGGKSFIAFYDSGDVPYFDFSNYARKPLKISDQGREEIIYRSPEHYFQAQKIIRADLDTQHLLRKQFNDRFETPNDARIGIREPQYKMSAQQVEQWNARGKEDAMLNVIRARCKQDPSFKKLLQNTGNKPLVEDTGGAKYIDDDWGCGRYGTGKNLLGILLMQVRAENRGKEQAAARKEANDLYQPIQDEIVAHLKTHPRELGTLLEKTLPTASVKSAHPNPHSLTSSQLDAKSPPYQVAMKILGANADKHFLISHVNNMQSVAEIKTNALFKDCKTPGEKFEHIKKLEKMLLAFQTGRSNTDKNTPIHISGTDPENRAILVELCKLHHLEYKCDDFREIKKTEELHGMVRKVAEESFIQFKALLPENMVPLPENMHVPKSGLRYVNFSSLVEDTDKPEVKYTTLPPDHYQSVPDNTQKPKDIGTQMQEKLENLRPGKNTNDDDEKENAPKGLGNSNE